MGARDRTFVARPRVPAVESASNRRPRLRPGAKDRSEIATDSASPALTDGSAGWPFDPYDRRPATRAHAIQALAPLLRAPAGAAQLGSRTRPTCGATRREASPALSVPCGPLLKSAPDWLTTPYPRLT